MEILQSIGAYHATAIILSFLLVFGILVPIVGIIPKVKEIISLRYLTLVVWLACTIGIIVNFSELSDSVKLSVVISTAIMSGIFVIARSIEKWLYNGWSFNREIKASVTKGDIKAEIEVKDKDTVEKDESDLKGLAKYEQGE